uniref:Uncharacterized protein n=1 Tax=Pinguiococcus pyrenoidosus TaxID=172671 RepID=A0A7R9YD58_9STRA|eukprot:scaffold1355_cov268-Pinguiococcus_pyrenoidosus.AAC.61
MQKAATLLAALCVVASGFRVKHGRVASGASRLGVTKSPEMAELLQAAHTAATDEEIELQLLRARERKLTIELQALKEEALADTSISMEDRLKNTQLELQRSQAKLVESRAALGWVRVRLAEAVKENSGRIIDFQNELKPMRAENTELQAAIKAVSKEKAALLKKQSSVPGTLVLFVVAVSRTTYSVTKTVVLAPITVPRSMFRSMFGRRKSKKAQPEPKSAKSAKVASGSGTTVVAPADAAVVAVAK